jgi:hypothetical protein
MRVINYKGRKVEVELVIFGTSFNGNKKRFHYYIKRTNSKQRVDKAYLKNLSE